MLIIDNFPVKLAVSKLPFLAMSASNRKSHARINTLNRNLLLTHNLNGLEDTGSRQIACQIYRPATVFGNPYKRHATLYSYRVDTSGKLLGSRRFGRANVLALETDLYLGRYTIAHNLHDNTKGHH